MNMYHIELTKPNGQNIKTNKRQGVEPKNVSAIVRDALELYLDSKQKS